MLTVNNPPEGFGAMYQGFIFGLAHCRKNNIKYLHTSLTTIHHGFDVEVANKLIGMEHYEKATKDTPLVPWLPSLWGIEDVDSLITKEVLKEVRNNYSGYGLLKEAVVIHIRRGDLEKDNPNHGGRWDELKQFIPVISYFKSNYDLPIIICTQAKKEELKELLDIWPDLEVDNGPAVESFKLMTNCKVLFVARSSFSYVPGMLNKNIVYGDAINNRWWHSKFKDWRTIPNLNFCDGRYMTNDIVIPDYCTKLYIDIGLSSEAIQTSNWLENVPDAFCLGFEPSPEAYNRIWSEWASDDRKLKKHNFNRLHIEPVALSNPTEPTTALFHRPNIDVGCSSLLKPADVTNPPFNGIKESYEVKVITLQHFFDNNKFIMERFNRIEYMKIDAQGSDLNILKGSSSFIKEHVVWVTAEGDGNYYKEECSEENKCTRKNIVKFMEGLGFVEYNHPKTSDATFYNPRFSDDFMNVYVHQY